jgi:hypothetical protein
MPLNPIVVFCSGELKFYCSLSRTFDGGNAEVSAGNGRGLQQYQRGGTAERVSHEWPNARNFVILLRPFPTQRFGERFHRLKVHGNSDALTLPGKRCVIDRDSQPNGNDGRDCHERSNRT